MGLKDLFRRRTREEVFGSKVLVCGLGLQFQEGVAADGEIYERYYRSVETATFSEIRELMDAVSRSPDIIHLFCNVSPGGEIANPDGTPVVGTELLDRCCEFNVKLLWIASDNESEVYIAGFKARGKRMNLVMTLKRNDPKFSRFLDQILFRMFYGDTLPVAWVDVSPQIPGSTNPDLPSAIFYAGRGGVKLR
jgi:hypothetical protein